MNVCPRCQAYNADAYVVCTSCGADLPKVSTSPYGRGFIEIMKTRFGMRLIAFVIALIVLGILSLVRGR